MRLFFYIKEIRVNLLNKTLKMAIFQPKMALNGQNSQFFNIDPIWLCLREAFKKKYYLDREIVPIPSDPPTIETVSEYLDSEYW